MDLGDLELVDESRQEIKIYVAAGCQEALIKEKVYIGMLFNLKTIHELFQRTQLAEQEADLEEDKPVSPHYLYPMVGLAKHRQAL